MSLDVRSLTVEYGSGGYRVRPLDGLDVSAEDGELVVLLGPSGCGKTTLLSCLAGLLTPTAGSVRFGAVDVTALRGGALAEYRRSTVGIVFQAFNLVKSLSARENVMAPLLLAGVRRRQAGARADELLELVRLGERGRHRPSGLSGGQQQRVAVARALVHDPPLLLADEPTAHLDHIQVEGVVRLLRDLAVPGRMVVVSTHDDRVTRLADRVVELAVGGKRAVTAEPVERILSLGEVLFTQGDASDLVYMIEEGEIALFRTRTDGTEERIAVMGAGHWFGEMGPLLGTPRSATAVAVSPARLTGLPIHEFSRRFPRFRAPARAEPAAQEA